MIYVIAGTENTGQLEYLSSEKEYLFKYNDRASSLVSLIMPASRPVYLWKNHLHPVFERYLPEGYLFEIFKNILLKDEGEINDYSLFSLLAPNITSRLTFTSDVGKKVFNELDLKDILVNDSEDTFVKLMRTFLHKNAISGIQPKTLALLTDKEQLISKEYIVKTWGAEFPRLAENEYFCMKAVEKAGVEIPNLLLSENGRFLLVERFDFDKLNDQHFGFEEVLGLMGKNRDQKYTGSYEQVAKVIYSVVTDKRKAMTDFFKLIVLNYLLGNGDGHLKNFGLLYSMNLKTIFFAPAYDVVSTVPYVFKDKPALSMSGKKLWFGRKELLLFGQKACQLSEAEAKDSYEKCCKSVCETVGEVKEYIRKTPDFKEIGSKLIDLWQLLLEGKTYKEIPVDTLRAWKNNS